MIMNDRDDTALDRETLALGVPERSRRHRDGNIDTAYAVMLWDGPPAFPAFVVLTAGRKHGTQLLAIDLEQRSFHIYGIDTNGKIYRGRLTL